MKQDHAGVLLVVFSAACYGFMSIFVKFAYAAGANLITVLAVRFVLASLFLWLLILFERQSVAISYKELSSLFLLSVLGYGMASTLFYASLQLITASLATMILFIHPVMVTVFEVIFYRYPLSYKKFSALFLSTVGLVLVLGNISGRYSLSGIIMALGAALSYTAYLLYGKRIVGKLPPVVVTAYILSFAAAGFTLYGLFSEKFKFDFPPLSWIWIIALALISTCMGILSLFAGLKRLEAGRASIIGTLEVVITLFFSAVLLGDVLTPLQITGGIMILAGIVILRINPGLKNKILAGKNTD